MGRVSKGKPARPASASKQERIDQVLRRQIVEGKLSPGQRLPTWDALEQRFHVSRVTLMRGLNSLHEDGFLVAATSRGTSVSPHPPHLYQFGMILPEHPDGRQGWSNFWQRLCDRGAAVQRQGPCRISFYYGLGWTPQGDELRRLHVDLARQRLAGLIFVAHSIHLSPDIASRARGRLPLVAISSLHVAPPTPMPVVRPDVDAFAARALDALAQRGRRRVAVLLNTEDPSSPAVSFWREQIARRGMESREYWMASVHRNHAGWAGPMVQTMLRLPAADRPDCLVVADDHLLDAVVHGLEAAGRNKLDVIILGNFPDPRPAPPHFHRLGFDCQRIFDVCLELLQRQREQRQPVADVLIPPRFEDEN